IKKKYFEQSNSLSSGLLLSALNIANQCEISYRSSKNQRLQIELALLKMCHLSSAIKLGVNGISTAQAEVKKKLPETVNLAPAGASKAMTTPIATPTVQASVDDTPNPPSPVKAADPEKKSFYSGKGWVSVNPAVAVPSLNTVFDEKSVEEGEES